MMRVSAEDAVVVTPMAKVLPAVQTLKQILGCHILGVEIYSPLQFPEINENDTRDTVTAKLKKAGFGIIEKNGICNVIDAAERSTGKVDYPFGKKVTVLPGNYQIEDIFELIEKQTDFKMLALLIGKSSPKAYDPIRDTAYTVRDVLNLIAGKMRGTWVAGRDSFGIYRYIKGGRWVEGPPPIKEDDTASINF